MLFLLILGVLVGVWILAVLFLASYFGMPQVLVGLGTAIWKRLKK